MVGVAEAGITALRRLAMTPDVIKVVPTSDYVLVAEFETGEVELKGSGSFNFGK